jgi:hypothetical protein
MSKVNHPPIKAGARLNASSNLQEATDLAISELVYGCGGLPEEKIVHQDENFVIVRYAAAPRKSRTGFIYEVIPISKTGGRLDDWAICPEHDTLSAATKQMERNRAVVRKYKAAKKREK